MAGPSFPLAAEHAAIEAVSIKKRALSIFTSNDVA